MEGSSNHYGREALILKLLGDAKFLGTGGQPLWPSGFAWEWRTSRDPNLEKEMGLNALHFIYIDSNTPYVDLFDYLYTV